jgi:small subunit ribosomal protein S6
MYAQVRPGNLQEVKEWVDCPPMASILPSRFPIYLPHLHTFLSRIARTTGTLVLRSNGVIRGLTNWGPFRLPRSVTKHQSRYTTGHYFIMRFDSSATVQENVRRTLGLDPRMVRFSVVRLGGSRGKNTGLEGIKDISGHVDWGVKPQDRLTSAYEG